MRITNAYIIYMHTMHIYIYIYIYVCIQCICFHNVHSIKKHSIKVFFVYASKHSKTLCYKYILFQQTKNREAHNELKPEEKKNITTKYITVGVSVIFTLIGCCVFTFKTYIFRNIFCVSPNRRKIEVAVGKCSRITLFRMGKLSYCSSNYQKPINI